MKSGPTQSDWKKGSESQMRGSQYSMDMKFSTYSNRLVGSKIAKLQDTGQQYTNKIKNETEYLKKLNDEIEENEKVLQQKRQEIYKAKKSEIGTDKLTLQKRIKNLENKLEVMKQKHNESLAQNRQLRNDIDKLRKEKLIFQNIYEQLRVELSQKKEDLLQIINNSDKAKDQITQAKETLKVAKTKAVEDQKAFEKEYDNVFKTLDEENTNQRFKDIRNLMKQKKEQENQKVKYKKFVQPFEGAKLANLSHFSRLVIYSSGVEISQHEEIFAKLKEETGNSNINEMVQTFVQYEENNYSLFKYINSLSDELEALMKQKKELQEQIKQNQTSETEQLDPRQIKIQQLKTEIDCCKEKQSKYDNKLIELANVLKTLKENIPTIFKKLGCDTEEFLNSDGEILDLNYITEGNILQFLGIIEKRTTEILEVYQDSQLDKKLIPQHNVLKKVFKEKEFPHQNDLFKTLNKYEDNFKESIKDLQKFDREGFDIKENKQFKGQNEFREEAKLELQDKQLVQNEMPSNKKLKDK